LGSRLQQTALLAARAVVQEVQLRGKSDFRALHATTSTYTLGSTTYAVDVSVEQNDFFTKTVKTVVSWGATFGRALSIKIPMLVTDPAHAVGGNTCYSEVDATAWKQTGIQNPERDFAKIVFDQNGIYTLAAIDAYKGKLYVAAGGTANKTDPTFFILNPSAASPTFVGGLDTATTTVNGIAALRVAEDVATGKLYAYAASNYTANFSSCKEYYNCAQLQIIDVTDPAATTLASIKNFKVPGVTGSQGAGKSIFYDQGYVYLGLAGTGNKGSEFNIIDVHDPTHPQLVGSYAVGSGVASIYIQNNLAYLATDNLSKEVMVLNVSNKTAPALVGSYNALSDVTNFGYGKSIDVVGDTVYLGRTFISNAPEFQILYASNPAAIPPPPIGVRDVGPNSSSPFSLNSILVRDTLAFLLLGSGTKGGSFQVFNIQNPASPQPYATVSLPSGSNGTGGAAMDCEANTFYVVSNDVAKKGYLSVISTI